MAHAKCGFAELAHTAEIGMRIWAPDPPRLFACAARALFSLVGALHEEDEHSAPVQHFHVQLEALDAESLLVDWLSELVYLYETSGLICAGAEIERWTPTALSATVFAWAPQQPPRLHVKAVTWHGLELAPGPEGWTATVYLDI